MSTDRIWELLSDQLRSFLVRRVSDEQLAEDLLQETFVRIHAKLDEIDDTERVPAWVFRIARNLVVDHYRSKPRRNAALEGDVEQHSNEDEHINALVAGWLPAMIAQLPDAYREAVTLYELEGVPQQQIADQLGISLSGAKSRVQRGREKLKALLLECCSLERDGRGNVIEYRKKRCSDGLEEDCDA